MSEELRQTELREKTQQLLHGPLKHIRAAALAAALLPLASVAAAPASAQTVCPSGGICGVVFNDTNNNGIQDAGETGIAGVTVILCQACNGTDSISIVTDLTGFYSLAPPNGTYTVAVLIPIGTQASPVMLGGNAGIPNGTGYSVASAVATAFDSVATDFGFFTTPPPSCTIPATREIISSTSWNKFSVPAGQAPVIWVHAQFKPSGIPTTTKTTVQFTGVSLVLNGISYPMLNGTVIFDPAAPLKSTTTFTGTPGTSSALWTTTINPNSISDENFFVGAAILVDLAITGGGQATLQFTTQTDNRSLSFSWQWSAAVYTYWPSGWNAALIQPYHGNGPTGSQHADTPDNSQIQKSLIQGPRGGGGSNFTGSWSATGQGACP